MLRSMRSLNRVQYSDTTFVHGTRCRVTVRQTARGWTATSPDIWVDGKAATAEGALERFRAAAEQHRLHR